MSVLNNDKVSLFCEQRGSDIAIMRCRNNQIKDVCYCEDGQKARDEWADMQLGPDKPPVDQAPVDGKPCKNNCGRQARPGCKSELCVPCRKEERVEMEDTRESLPLCSKCEAKPVQKNTHSRKWEKDGKDGTGLCYGCYIEILEHEKIDKPSKQPVKSRPVVRVKQQTSPELIPLKTFHAVDYDEPEEAIERALGFVKMLNGEDITVDVQITISILPDEGRLN